MYNYFCSIVNYIYDSRINYSIVILLVLISLIAFIVVMITEKISNRIRQEKRDLEEVKEELRFARKAIDSKTDFLNHICHEIKTPINAILGMTQIALNSLSDMDKVKGCLEKIDFSSRNLIELTNNILDTAKHNCNKLYLHYEPFYLLKSIKEFSSTMAVQAEVKGIDYKFIYHKMVHDYLMGDLLRILQILGNCLSNSIKFTPSGGRITLEVFEVEYTDKDSLYRFIIADNGKGMDPDYISHIFEPFDQEDRSIYSRYGGSGLGMSIVKNILDLMGGTILIDSKVDFGTTITVDIRLGIAPMNNAEIDTKQSLWHQPGYDFKGMRVLVVEDNEINLEITTEYLRFMNIQVDSVTNGFDAFKQLEESTEGYYAAILIDLQMPGINGYETSSLIRGSGHPDAERIPILAMTADSLIDQSSCIQHGMNYYISKPIDKDSLYAAIYHLIHDNRRKI